MGHIFQAECWEKTIVDITFGLFMDKEIGKGMGKGKEALIGILFMK